MSLKSKLIKAGELTELLFYSQFPPQTWANLGYERRTRLVDKYRDVLTNNPYFTKFIEPLVLRLHDDAIKSKNVVKYPCVYKGSTLLYKKGHFIFPILTMGSKQQLEEICKKECYVCPTVVYSPLAVLDGLIQLSIFEAAGVVSKLRYKNKR